MEKLDEKFSLRGSCGIIVRSVVWLRHFVFIVVVNFVSGPAGTTAMYYYYTKSQ